MFDSEGESDEEVKQSDRGFGDLASAVINQPQIAKGENQNQEDTTQ